MARLRCNICQGEYDDVGADGVPYFHACPPIARVRIRRDGPGADRRTWPSAPDRRTPRGRHARARRPARRDHGARRREPGAPIARRVGAGDTARRCPGGDRDRRTGSPQCSLSRPLRLVPDAEQPRPSFQPRSRPGRTGMRPSSSPSGSAGIGARRTRWRRAGAARRNSQRLRSERPRPRKWRARCLTAARRDHRASTQRRIARRGARRLANEIAEDLRRQVPGSPAHSTAPDGGPGPPQAPDVPDPGQGPEPGLTHAPTL